MIFQRYHLRRGVHSRSLQAPQVDPNPAFARPPLPSVVFQFVPGFSILPSACAGSLKAPQDLTSLPKGDILLICRFQQLWISGGEVLVESWQGLDTFQFFKGDEVETGEPLCGRRKSGLRTWCDRSELIEAFAEVFQ